MLVLSRKAGEAICIGNDIRLTVSVISGGRVKLCIDAPRECAIRRQEIVEPQRRAHAAQIPAGAVAR